MTYLTVPITENNAQAALDQARLAKKLGAEMIEFRLDYLSDLSPDTVKKLIADARRLDRPVIATCRSTQQGGHFTGSPDDLNNILLAAYNAGADHIDLELTLLAEEQSPLNNLLNLKTNRLIISHHDFDAPISNPADILNVMDLAKPAASKIAAAAPHINDAFPILDELYSRDSNQPQRIALAMGPAGAFTRLIAKKFDAFLTFASLNPKAASAPGQITLDQMKTVYRWDKINEDTELYGVIGNPIGHSLSPLVHNAAFDETNHNGLYLPLLVEGDQPEFDRFICNVLTRPWLDFRGFSVTIPHKLNALRFIEQTGGKFEPLAQKIKAVNTIIIDDDDTLIGFNTDYAAAMDAVAEALHTDWKGLKNLNAAVIGAGGVARSIVAGLRDCGARVTIYNRTADKAAQLADEFDCSAAPLDDSLRSLDAKLIVNCTSVGMAPNINFSPLPQRLIKNDMIVFDTVYNPRNTLLLQHAKLAGATPIDGLTMFVNQAARQFEFFTGHAAPVELMTQILTANLEKK